MSSSAAVEADMEEDDVNGGELLFCGATCWDATGRRKLSTEGKLVSPTRLRSLVGVDIRYVASGCESSHCVALGVDGRCYTWGRNENGQLGHGDKFVRNCPTVVSGLSQYKVVKAATGGGHTVVLTEDGISFSFGWNNHGQLGTCSMENEFELSPIRCIVSDARHVACGTEFTVWLTSIQGSSILTAGHPQYGQLGHGTYKKHNTKERSVRLAFEDQPHPKAIASLSDETIVKVACGSNHTVALDSKGYVYTWGSGGYGRLGHNAQKDEWSPRRIDFFTKHNVLPPGAVISAGSVTSACTKGVGQMYMWGKVKNSSECWMYPKPLLDLSKWNIHCMDSGNSHNFVGAENSCISWGNNSQSGELGYGPNKKSSAIPKKVDALEGMHVISVACGLAHTLVVVDRSNVNDQLEQLDVYDAKDTVVECGSEADNSNKRQKLCEESSESEVALEESSDENDDDSDEETYKGSDESDDDDDDDDSDEESSGSYADSDEETDENVGQKKLSGGTARGRHSAATK